MGRALHRDLHDAGGVLRVMLQAGKVHAPLLHCLTHPLAARILTDTADKQRVKSERVKMPRNIERGTTKDFPAVRKCIEQYLAEDYRPPFNWRKV
jgi:hypothetical protein